MARANEQPSHNLIIGDNKIGIYHENKRLYKICDWKSTKPIIYNFIKSHIIKLEPELKDIYFTIDLKEANPMRRTRYGNFYFQVAGTIHIKSGEKIFLEEIIPNSNIPVSRYICLDEEENKKRKDIEKSFGIDQYTKQKEFYTQAIDSIIQESEGKQVCMKTEEDVDKFIMRFMNITGWDINKDNRLHSRIPRLPNWMVIPE